MSVPPVVIELIIAGLILGLTYALISEGAWGATLMFFNIVFGGLIAFNFYEPLARLIDSTGIGWGFSDALCILLLFSISVLLLRMTTESLAPAMVRFPVPIYHIVRVVFALGGALVTMAIVILAFHAAPVHKKIFGAIDYNSKPPFGLGLDHQWLGFFQYATGGIFTRYGSGGTRDPFSEYGRSGAERVPIHLFDPKARWLLDHQEARPYGTGTILGEEGGGAAAAGAGAAGGAGAGGAPEGGATKAAPGRGAPGRGGPGTPPI